MHMARGGFQCQQAVDAPPAALQPTATVLAADNDISNSSIQSASLVLHT